VGPTCRRPHEGEGAGAGAGGPRGPKAGMGRGVGRWVGFVFFLFFSNPFQIFFKPFLNSNLLHKFSQLFLKLFTSILRLLKPHHSQNSCIQIMMHKHLLLLNY
jgi:hypothetical protein